MELITLYGHWIPTLFAAAIFIQSLRHKFARSGETIYIFEEKLDAWAATFGFKGLFAPGGLFSAVHIGVGELVASLLLLLGALNPTWFVVQGFGALLGLGIISGAIFFHLFTPLGVAIKRSDGTSDRGSLFMFALGVWVSCAALVLLRLPELLALVS